MSGPAPAGARGPILALEASTASASAALRGPGGELWEQWQQPAGERGTAPLAAGVAALLAARGLNAQELSGVVVGLGPGSYTGVRAAIALARGLVFGREAGRLAGVPSTAAAARGALLADPRAETVVVLVDARREECYRADYARGPAASGGVSEIAPPRLVRSAEAEPPPAAGRLVLREPVPSAQDLAVLGRLVLLAGGSDPARVLPLYLKRAHAEIVFDERKTSKA
ncbi:MAG: tRNA (adenosine(37)-N6)-threonylcarbamoyltransferase complex dimerization subunit type 1 TsaB [Planctomycetota bacterium]